MAPRKRARPTTSDVASPRDLPKPRTRELTIIAQDPGVKRNGRILRSKVTIPAELLVGGPWGHRVQVIDYDATTDTLYAPPDHHGDEDEGGVLSDPYASSSDATLLVDPRFHAQNVYTIAMRTLARFEFALGRRVSWGFGGHQLKIAPHAFCEANAFYSERDEALVFGYFPALDGKRTVFSCLSHDVVAHETTHALVDGLRTRFGDPSSPDQAAFHEGFADVVALLSIFSLRGIVEDLIDRAPDAPAARAGKRRRDVIARTAVTAKALSQSTIFWMAEQMGREMSIARGGGLRRSLEISPSREYYLDPQQWPEYLEPHRRGEILVAAMMNAFVHVWSSRLARLGDITPGHVDRSRVVEEGALAADHLLTMAIRALDYTPPAHLLFGDFLSALLTADVEIRPDDSRYQFRNHLRASFERFGVTPTSKSKYGGNEPGVWTGIDSDKLTYTRTHFESMLRDPDEVFWFIWENRVPLGVYEGAYGHVLSVRPCLRAAPDGFPLRETVAEFYQVLQLTAVELPKMKLKIPDGMPLGTRVSLYGGNTLIFDEYGRLKFNIHNGIIDSERQQRRIDYLWRFGYFSPEGKGVRRFAAMHMRRAMDASLQPDASEVW